MNITKFLHFSYRQQLLNLDYFIFECKFLSCISSYDGSGIYFNFPSKFLILSQSYFFNCRSINSKSGGGAFLYGNIIEINKTCFYHCYAYDNGSGFRIENTNKGIINYVTCSYCPSSIDDTYQDSFKLYCSSSSIKYLNSSYNTCSDVCSNCAFKSSTTIGIYEYSNLYNLTDKTRSPIVTYSSINFFKCNFILLKFQYSIIDVWNTTIFNINNCIFNSFSNNVIAARSESTINLNYCILDFSPINLNGLINSLNLSIGTVQFNFKYHSNCYYIFTNIYFKSFSNFFLMNLYIFN